MTGLGGHPGTHADPTGFAKAGNGFPLSIAALHAPPGSTKVLDHNNALVPISYENSTPVGLPRYRSKIKIGPDVRITERQYKQIPTFLLKK
jgi:hypothetical protein